MLIKIKNSIEEISKICDQVGDFCKANEISEEKFHDIVLILDEVVTNVISYAYPDGEDHDFILSIDKEGDRIVMELVDNGIPFDVLRKADPDVDSAIEQRQIGGLGIFIVKQLAEVVEYSRTDDKNQLSITVSLLNNEATAATKE
ncbi:MAG: ATP-binding protein [Holosporaceae bacterium]|jgi:anti-sigma regulatory factor (Ser/Thr protein kinase)|nr:ATP-binding protein [Holosporaceae bacterium]